MAQPPPQRVATTAEIRARLDEWFESLRGVDTADLAPRARVPGDDAWSALIAAGPPLMTMAQVERVLDRPLIANGEQVEIVIAKVDTWAQPTCQLSTRRPIIVLDPGLVRRVLPFALAFIKEHELQHILAGDVQCDVPEKHWFDRYNTSSEKHADCAARDAIRAAYPGELAGLILGNTAGAFQASGKPRTPFYESGADRAVEITVGCGP
jgi:hypothetical protein